MRRAWLLCPQWRHNVKLVQPSHNCLAVQHHSANGFLGQLKLGHRVAQHTHNPARLLERTPDAVGAAVAGGGWHFPHHAAVYVSVSHVPNDGLVAATAAESAQHAVPGRSTDSKFDGGLHTIKVVDLRPLTGDSLQQPRVISQLPFTDTDDSSRFTSKFLFSSASASTVRLCFAANCAPGVCTRRGVVCAVS